MRHNRTYSGNTPGWETDAEAGVAEGSCGQFHIDSVDELRSKTSFLFLPPTDSLILVSLLAEHTRKSAVKMYSMTTQL